MTVSCSVCGMQIPYVALKCPYCLNPTGRDVFVALGYRLGGILLLPILLTCGIVTLWMQQVGHESGKAGFEGRSSSTTSSEPFSRTVEARKALLQPQADDDNFHVIVLYESADTAARKLVHEGVPQIKGPPAAEFIEEGGPRQFFDARQIIIDKLPPLAFLQKINRKPDTFEYRTLGPTDWTPIYTVIRKPHAIAKLKTWAKNNRYDGWQFELQYQAGWGTSSTYTEPVEFTKPGSRVTLVGFFEGRSGLFLWDGEKTYDCTSGINSRVGGSNGESHYRKYVRLLETLLP